MFEDVSNFKLTKELTAKLDAVLNAHGNDSTQIVDILLDAQDLIEQHYIPKIVAGYIAEHLPTKLSVIYDCITFYDKLSDRPRGKYPIEVCNSIACRVNDSDFLLQTLTKLLNIKPGEITYDGRFTIELTDCFGACDRAPAVRINKVVYGPLRSEEEIKKMLEKML